MPLFREYRTFQHFALRECYDAIRDPQKKFLTSHDFHGHSAPLGTHVEFDSIGEAIQRSDNAKIPLLYRLTDAAGRFNYITEGPEGEWENTALGRLRLCQAYAYGAVWVVPHKQGIRRDGKWLRVSPEVKDLMRKWQVRGVPTVVFLDRSGQIMPELTLVGFEGPDSFLARLRIILAKDGMAQGNK